MAFRCEFCSYEFFSNFNLMYLYFINFIYIPRIYAIINTYKEINQCCTLLDKLSINMNTITINFELNKVMH